MLLQRGIKQGLDEWLENHHDIETSGSSRENTYLLIVRGGCLDRLFWELRMRGGGCALLLGK